SPIIIDFLSGGFPALVPNGTGFTFNATGVVLPASAEAAFLGGLTYLNIHTTAVPGGLIWGQNFSSGNTNLTTGAATGTGGIANDLTGVTSLTALNLNGFNGNDLFNINAAMPTRLSVNVTGNLGNDTLAGPNLASTWNIPGTGPGTIPGVVSSINSVEAFSGG